MLGLKGKRQSIPCTKSCILGKWMEVLGCGITEAVLRASGRTDIVAWAFGLVLFDIPDVYLLLSANEQFTSQYMKRSVPEGCQRSMDRRVRNDTSQLWYTPSGCAILGICKEI